MHFDVSISLEARWKCDVIGRSFQNIFNIYLLIGRMKIFPTDALNYCLIDKWLIKWYQIQR